MNWTYIVKVIHKICKSSPRDKNSTTELISGYMEIFIPG